MPSRSKTSVVTQATKSGNSERSPQMRSVTLLTSLETVATTESGVEVNVDGSNVEALMNYFLAA